jgi:hypothetical protein
MRKEVQMKARAKWVIGKLAEALLAAIIAEMVIRMLGF